MEEIQEALKSPFWWFSVVLVGIVINVGSSFLKTYLDTFLSSISNWWRDKSNARKEKYNKVFNQLEKSENERFMLSFMCNRDMHHSIHLAVYSALIIIVCFYLDVANSTHYDSLLNVVLLGLSAFMFFSSYLTFITSIRKRQLLFSVLKKIDS
ncbi:hypothetical protein [Halomonas sp. SCS19]|uniref:hypothetical protein n=1 Tax=Halomonas sp. SCS19 TaxID=2950870 RepID=UPI0032DE8EB0